MGHEFDSQIEVEREGGGVFSADLSAGWVVGGGVNGGYLLAVIGNALRASLPGKPDPLAVSAHYLSATTCGPPPRSRACRHPTSACPTPWRRRRCGRSPR